jgi:putative thioredoxin
MSTYSYDVSAADFEQKVLQLSLKVPVLVDFWAPWCGPCRTLGPILEKLADEFGGRFLLAKVNSDENQSLAYEFGVRSIPSVKAFAGGQLVDEFVGALPESGVRAFLQRLLPSLAEPLRQDALTARAQGDTARARALLQEALATDPRHEAARLDLVELLVEAGEVDAGAGLLDAIGDAVREPDRIEALRARIALANAAPAGSDRGALEARIAANPADLDARLALATVLAQAREWRPALEHLMEIVRRDRGFGDDAGRKTMIQYFNLLGPDDPLVREFRAGLASLLNR